MDARQGPVTQLIQDLEAGDDHAADRLLEAVYEELRALAAARLRREKPGQTLQATALVHEAYLRLLGNEAGWNSRAHFFGAAAEAMRRILVEQARRKRSARHGGGRARGALNDSIIGTGPQEDDTDIVALSGALAALEQSEPEKAVLVKLRHFTGLNEKQCAEVLGISRATAARHWAYARAWLYDHVARSQDGDRSQYS